MSVETILKEINAAGYRVLNVTEYPEATSRWFAQICKIGEAHSTHNVAGWSMEISLRGALTEALKKATKSKTHRRVIMKEDFL